MAFVDEFGSRGDAPSLLFPGGQAISYAELDRRTADLCRTFGARRKLIAVEARPSEHAIVAYLAALRGRHPVALLPPDDAAALDEFIADFAPDIIFARSDGRWRCTEAGRSLRRTAASRSCPAARHVGLDRQAPLRPAFGAGARGQCRLDRVVPGAGARATAPR